MKLTEYGMAYYKGLQGFMKSRQSLSDTMSENENNYKKI